MKQSVMLTSLCALGLSACVSNDRLVEPEPIAGAVATDLRDMTGRSVGTATGTQEGDRLRIRIVGTALPPGVHGAHLHAVGACQPPDFASAGPHWNPTGRQHGTQNPQGHHLGDLPNLLIGTDGQGTLEFVAPAVQLERGDRALIDRDGASLVIHALADDNRTDPSGNSGARIACGVLQPVIDR